MQLYSTLWLKTLTFFQEYGFIRLLTLTKRGLIMENESIEKAEAATYRKIIQFLREAKDVQNIDLMNLAGFCRNCISKWYMASAKEEGIEINYEEARKTVYGMSYNEWKEKYQK